MDVCDDADYSQMLKGYSDEAKAAGVPAITSAGACFFINFLLTYILSRPCVTLCDLRPWKMDDNVHLCLTGSQDV